MNSSKLGGKIVEKNGIKKQQFVYSVKLRNAENINN